MSEPRRLTVEAPPGLEPLAALVRSVEPHGEPAPGSGARMLALAEARLNSRPSFARQALAFAAAAAVAAALVWVAAPRHDVAPYTVEAGALLRPPSGDAPAHLQRGHIHGAPASALARLETPHASIAWTQASFLLDVDTRGSTLVVEAGDVVWRADGVEQRVTAGARVRAPALLAVPAALEPGRVDPSADCSTLSLDPRLGCLERLSQGDSLKAQNALFELALLQREERHRPELAVQSWSMYLARFPDGALAPEASLGLLGDLVRLQRYPEALEVARAHERRFPSLYPEEVKTVEARLAERIAKEHP